MAWYKRYRIPFKSLLGTQYMVYIYEQSSGSIVTLTGAAEPFTTREDEEDNVFTPIRTQSGFIRVIDETGGSLIENIMPQNNTQKLVRLYSGAWDSGMTTFTDGFKLWEGFLCAQAFTQPWDGQKNVIEFPVISRLAALKGASIQSSTVGSDIKLSKLIYDGFSAIGVSFTYLYCFDNFNTAASWLTKQVRAAIFFDIDKIESSQSTSATYIGKTYYDILCDILMLFGFTARESGTNLYMMQYGVGSDLKVHRFGWNGLNGTPSPTTVSGPTSAALLSSVTFRGRGNDISWVLGRNKVTAELRIQSFTLGTKLPDDVEDSATPIDVQDISSGHVYVQPHSPRTNGIETFSFSEYQTQRATSTRVGSSTYQNCLQNSVLYRPLYDPHASQNDNLHTGAFPCRFYYQKEAGAVPSMKSGLFLNQQYFGGSLSSFTPSTCYTLQTPVPYTFDSGYLNINMFCNNFMRGILAGDYNKLYFGQFNTMFNEMPQTRMWFILTWGNKEWNGEEWVTISGNHNTFTIDFDGSAIKTNKDESMLVEKTDGWFIPIDQHLSGYVKLYILNVSQTTGSGLSHDAHSRIISDLEMEYYPNVILVNSHRSENIYSQNINGGFDEDYDVYLTIGTINNNVISPSFIKDSDTEYTENMEYVTGSSVSALRPEDVIVSRAATYFAQARQTMRAIIQSGIDILSTIYTYSGRNFLAIDANHNWRDDEQEVKFIEDL